MNPGRRRPFDALVLVFLVAVIFMLRMRSFGDKSISCDMDAERLGVAYGGEKHTFVPFEDITGAELLTTFSMGECVEQLTFDGGWVGTYENADWGRYEIYAYSDCGLYIAVHHKDGTLVFNAAREKTTEEEYNRLRDRTNVSHLPGSGQE